MKRNIARHIATAFFTVAAFSSLSAGAANACACCDSYSVQKVAYWDVLNVRTGPGMGYHIIGGLKPNESCIWKSGERRGNWVRVYAAESDQRGWVHSRYLRYRSGY